MSPDEIVQALETLPKEEVRWEDYTYVIDASEPWDPIKWPQNHDWFLVKDVPLRLFSDVSFAAISAVEDPEERKEHRERYKEIRDLLKSGEEPWPVIVADGMILDGYHRLAAMKTLRRKFVDVLLVQEET